MSVGLEYKSVVMLPSLTVVLVSRKDILVFDTVCEFYRRIDTVGMFEKFIKLFIAMYLIFFFIILKICIMYIFLFL